eukprot:INCI4649.1.p2 GENE.INCI4649.1~~INCI4649.1.p2  ORF type:complete len:165 (+),score=25.24 INCI4649.1:394-888(+)
MRTFEEDLAMYAKYHRDLRNIATHVVGIPLIVTSLAILAARPQVEVAGVVLPWLLTSSWVAASAFYVFLNWRFGLLMSALLLFIAKYAAAAAATGTTGEWLILSISMFSVGWVFQFVGHWFEGKKPAFFDDLMGLPIGPMFVVAEVMYFVGCFPDLRQITKSNH